MMKTDYDVIIIGGGLVGSALASALKYLPISIAIVEANATQEKRPETFDARAISLSPASISIFQGLELWQALLPHTTAIHSIHVSDQGRFGGTRFHAKEINREALGYVCEAHAIGEVMYESIRHQSNLTWWTPATLSSLQKIHGRAQVELETVEGKVTLSAALVVGADGASSKTRSLAGIGEELTPYYQTAIVTTVGLDGPHHHRAFERFTTAGPIALLPLSGQRSAVIWSAPNDVAKSLLQSSDAHFLERLQSTFGYRSGHFARIGNRSHYPLTMKRSLELTQSNVVLIGNAAHALHPIAGQGFNLGLRDMAVLAQIIKTCLREKNFGDDALLKTFATAREKDQQLIQWICDFLPRIFSHQFLPYAWFRNACILTLDTIPFWKKYFMQQASGSYGRQSTLACGTPLSE